MGMTTSPNLDQLTPEQLRTFAAQLLLQVQQRDEQIQTQGEQLKERDRAIAQFKRREAKLTHELALLRRHRFGKRSEGLDKQQLSLLGELVEADIAAIDTELASISVRSSEEKARQQPKRQALPPSLPRKDIHHEPDNTRCECGCQLTRIGEDIHEKLDFQPGTFTVERHIRGKWACRQCESLSQAPVVPHIIDKGIPTTGVLSQILINKYTDHLPLHRQAQQFARAGVTIPRATLAGWVGRCGVECQPLVDAWREALLNHSVLHADETSVAMLAPGKKKTHRAYVWAYATTHFAPVQGCL